MYREGPPGTPFHTLLVEGYIEGTIDACESTRVTRKFLHFATS